MYLFVDTKKFQCSWAHKIFYSETLVLCNNFKCHLLWSVKLTVNDGWKRTKPLTTFCITLILYTFSLELPLMSNSHGGIKWSLDINFPQMTRTVPINIITSFLNTWIENETAYFPTNKIVWLSQKHFTNQNSKATNKLHSNYCYFVSQSHDNHENELKRVRYNKKGKILKRVLLEFKEGFNGWRRNSRTNKNNQISLYSVIQFRCSQRLMHRTHGRLKRV